jgi:CRP/FNR family transcriptional regulator, cyclic AMP receptor protein
MIVSGRTNFLEGISLQELPQMVRVAQFNRQFPRNTYIFRAGDQAVFVYILIEGRIRLSRLLESGKNVTFSILYPTSIFGEADILGNVAYSNDAQAIDDCIVCSIRKADFVEMLQLYPALLIRLHKILAERWKEAQEQIELLATLGVREKVIHVLQRYAWYQGILDKSKRWYAVQLNQPDISELAGITRESVNKVLGELKRENVLQIHGQIIEVSRDLVNGNETEKLSWG